MLPPTYDEIVAALKYWARQREPLNKGVDTNWVELRNAEANLEEMAKRL